MHILHNSQNPTLENSTHLIINKKIQIVHLVQPIHFKTLTPIPSNIVELPKYFFISKCSKFHQVYTSTNSKC